MDAPRHLRRATQDEEAITPIIGTVLILAVTVAGMAVILFLGAPVIARLQDEASLRSMTSQFETARHAMASLSIPDTTKVPGLSLPGGTVTLESGDSFLVAADQDTGSVTVTLDTGGSQLIDVSGCDLHVTNWADSDLAHISLTASTTTTCRTPEVGSCNPVLGIQVTSCFHARRLSEAATTNHATIALNPSPILPSVTTAPTITLDTSLGNTEDWVFTLNNNAGTDSPSASTVYAQAWLLRTQRLHWAQSSNGGGVEANLEFGAIFLRSGSQAYLDADPFITESPTSATTPPYLLRLPSLTPGSTGSLAGSGTHSVAFRLTSSDVLAQIPTTSGGQAVTRLRLDVQGTLADIWCSSLVLRNNFQTLPTGYSYAADTTTWPCSQTAAQLAASSGVRSLVYDSSSATATVPFQLTHGNLAASLQV